MSERTRMKMVQSECVACKGAGLVDGWPCGCFGGKRLYPAKAFHTCQGLYFQGKSDGSIEVFLDESGVGLGKFIHITLDKDTWQSMLQEIAPGGGAHECERIVSHGDYFDHPESQSDKCSMCHPELGRRETAKPPQLLKEPVRVSSNITPKHDSHLVCGNGHEIDAEHLEAFKRAIKAEPAPAAPAAAPEAPAPAADAIERAKEIVSSWPDWKGKPNIFSEGGVYDNAPALAAAPLDVHVLSANYGYIRTEDGAEMTYRSQVEKAILDERSRLTAELERLTEIADEYSDHQLMCGQELRRELEQVKAERDRLREADWSKNFSQRNRRRCESASGFNHRLDSWSMSDWMVAVLGELGEAANIVKKLNRVRDGIPGNTLSAEQLRHKLALEIADAYIYLDLLCQSVGIDLQESVESAFTGKSKQIGYAEAALGEKGSEE